MPNEITKIPTGLASSFPQGMYLRITDRSSLALQNLTIQGGVIDSDYRGEIMILMKNNTNVPVTFTPDQKVAQFIFERVAIPQIQISNTLPPSKQKGGFGSTSNTASQPNIPKTVMRRLYISPNTTLIYSTSSKHQAKRISKVQKSDTVNNTYINEMKKNNIHPEHLYDKIF